MSLEPRALLWVMNDTPFGDQSRWVEPSGERWLLLLLHCNTMLLLPSGSGSAAARSQSCHLHCYLSTHASLTHAWWNYTSISSSLVLCLIRNQERTVLMISFCLKRKWLYCIRLLHLILQHSLKYRSYWNKSEIAGHVEKNSIQYVQVISDKHGTRHFVLHFADLRLFSSLPDRGN